MKILSWVSSTQVLTSWINTEDPGMGLFSLEVDHTEKQYVLKWNNSVQYWTSGPWNDEDQIFALVPEMRLDYTYNFSYIDNENESCFTYSLYNPSITSRLFINVSGKIQQQSWLDASQQWQSFSSLRELCQESWPFCNCLTSFKPTSGSDWNLTDFSGGCKRKTKSKCRVKEEKPGFIVSYVPVEFLSSFLENETHAFDESACRRSCLDDCSCDAFTFILKRCQLWNGKNLNNISLVFVSEDPNRKIYMFNVKVSFSSDIRNTAAKINTRVLVAGTVSGIFGLVFLCSIGLIFYRRLKRQVAGTSFVLGLILFFLYIKKRMLVRKSAMMGSLVVFVYRDLQIATKNFSDRLGGGGFGSIFKRDSSIVAVKRLESISQGEKEFRSEISTIGNIQHVNLVRFFGFCVEGDIKLLVYDYMPNGSLHSHLFHEKPVNVLNWKTRYEIAFGTAKGLVYLHEKCRDCIIHCDIKPVNILLGADFCPKIADFGLAKLVGRDFSKVLTTMRGTRGYLAPEWLSGVPVTAKVDVFSYVMMLFELVRGKRNAEISEDSTYTFFPSLAATVIMSEGDILGLLDSRLNREASVEEVTKVCKVAYWCIQDNEDSRPSMSQVEQILEGVSDVNMPPIPHSFQFFADNSEHTLFFIECSSAGSSQPSNGNSLNGNSKYNSASC